MKNLFKKNQIIVTALALMIAVAGYLNFTKDQADLDEAKKLASGSDYLLGSVSSMAGQEGTGEKTGENLADAAALENQKAEEDGTDEFADNFDDEDAAQTAQIPVGDNGELLTGDADTYKDDLASKDNGTAESNPGDAVLASTTPGSGYFASAKLSREQTRAKNKETLMELISNTDISEEQKQEAINTMINLTAIAEKENAAEMLLEARGFTDVVVRILEDSVDVVVNAAEITEQEIAQIEDIVIRKTGAKASEIVITSVVAGD